MFSIVKKELLKQVKFYRICRDFVSLIKVFKSMLQLYNFLKVIELRFLLRHHGKMFPIM